MNKILSKFKMRQVIVILCVLSCIFTLAIGAGGSILIKKINENVEWIYGYYEWTDNLQQIDTNMSDMKANRLSAQDTFDTKYIDAIKENNDIIMKNYNEYTATDNQTEEEDKAIKKIHESYDEYYKLTNEALNLYKNGQTLDNTSKQRLAELEKTIDENVEWLKSYIKEWAVNDKTSCSNLYKSAMITYLAAIVICIVVFSFIALKIVEMFKKEVKEINGALEEVASGNLSIKAEIDGNNEFDQMKKYINRTIESFSNIVGGLKGKSTDIDTKSEDLKVVSESLTSSVNNISEAIGNVATGAEEQAGDMVEITTILNNFSNNIDNFIDNLQYLNKSSNEITERANLSSIKMDELAETFKYIQESIKSFVVKISNLSITINEVSNITSLINGIAEQTNLLALNAAIESARVGEAGKGFAVVADEIRKLAEQSRESSNNITTLINGVSEDTRAIVDDSSIINDKLTDSSLVITDSLSSFKNIIVSIDEIVPRINDLNVASQDINKEKNTIFEKIEKSTSIAQEMSAASEEVVASLSEMNEGCEGVSTTANNLNELTNTFESEIQLFKLK
ncbi:methyl-accepting chemotaxis protein [Clostridium sp. CTA-5]